MSKDNPVLASQQWMQGLSIERIAKRLRQPEALTIAELLAGGQVLAEAVLVEAGRGKHDRH